MEAIQRLIEGAKGKIGYRVTADNHFEQVCMVCKSSRRLELPDTVEKLAYEDNVPAGFDEKLFHWLVSFQKKHAHSEPS